MEGRAGAGCGNRVAGGENGAEGAGDGESGGSSVKHPAVIPGATETVESVEERGALVGQKKHRGGLASACGHGGW